MRKKISLVEERKIYQNEFYLVFDDRVRFPSGKEGTYFRVRNADNPLGAVIIPRLPDGRFVLLENYRYAAGKTMLEFPRGLGDVNESSAEIAKRELLEETGFGAATWARLGQFMPNGAIFEEQVEVWLADLNCEQGDIEQPDEGAIALHKYSSAQVRQLVADGKLTDGFTLSALALLWMKV
ncbi:MAG: NUDIX hydrolase [Planctomycetes bacterium]|nr:NUDIX hydrolase [Planctomycetota bacterium]